MLKRIAIILSLFLISLVDAGSSLAQSEFVIFGPKQYDKPKGKPVTYTDTFKAYPATYQLWVQSGQDGLNEVKNVSVSINGVEVLDSRDLRKSNPSIKTINLQSTNTIKVVLKGQGGNFIKVKVVAPPLNITVLSPSAGETISSPKVIVTGTIENFIGELGVTVNGIVADVYGNQFVVSNVPLVEGANTITVTAKDALRTATSSITVNAVIPSCYIELSSNIESGIAPLTAYFSASISNLTPSSYQMDFEGDGIVDWTGASFEDISHTYTLEGIFYPTVIVTDSQGNSYWDVIAITVLSRAEMDALLKGKWEGMRGALANENLEEALNNFAQDSKEQYRKAFTILQERLSLIASEMQNIELIYMLGDIAKCRITREQVIDGQMRTITYYIYFTKNQDGIWQIEQF